MADFRHALARRVSAGLLSPRRGWHAARKRRDACGGTPNMASVFLGVFLEIATKEKKRQLKVVFWGVTPVFYGNQQLGGHRILRRPMFKLGNVEPGST